MAQTEAYRRGDEVRRQLMGDALVDRMAANVYDDPMMQKFGDYAREAVFGLLWTRPGLDLKTRTLITVVSDTATGRWPELAIHLRMALRQGWTQDELSEALLHLGGYIGLPSVREAMLTAREVFAEDTA
jgi:4-carboxymuconolactone decarboxylase